MPTVLIVDDDAQVCRFAATVLEAQGFSVLTARSGPEALLLAAANRNSISLLLTDVEMPGMDGATLARKIECISPRMPVILMSGACDAPALSVTNSVCFLRKPFSPAQLVRLVQSVGGSNVA